MPNVFCNQDWPGVVSQNFRTTLGRLKICFWLVWPSVNKEESQLKTYADVVGFSSVFCYAIVIPLCLLYLYGKQHIVLRASRTTVVAWQYIQQKFCTIKFFVLVIFRFEHKTQKNTRFDSSFNLSFIQATLDTCFASFFIQFLVSWGNGLSKGPFDAVPLRGLGFRYDEDFQEGGGLYLAFGCGGCSLHLCAISWAGVLDLVSIGFFPSII